VPTYQYSCNDCGHFHEIVQRFSEDSLTVCPECEGRLRKVFNAVGVVFKGSGFYRNDSRAPAGSENSPDKSPDKSSGKSSDNGSKKPAEKGSSTTKPDTSSGSSSDSSSGSSRAPAATT
jgi:putative FmdB family regulatory protein